MRAALAITLLAAAALLALLLAGQRGADAPAVRSSPQESARLADLQRRVEGQAEEMAAMRRELEGLRQAVREALSMQGRGAGEAVGPSWAFSQYLHSFQGGGSGSEYFRLVVEAHLEALLPEIEPILRDGAAAPALRAQLLRLLARPSFRGNSAAVVAALGALRGGGPDAVLLAAAETLTVIGDATSGALLERLVPGFDSAAARHAAYKAIVMLSGEEVGRAVERLLGQAPDPASRQFLVGMLSPADPEGSVDALRRALSDEREVRLAAARKLASYRTDAARRLVEERLGVESDPEVRKALERTKQSFDTLPSWHPLQATGAPDALPNTQDNPKAWAAQPAEGGRQWLELSYATPLRASALRIHEVLTAGGVAEVELVDEQGVRRTIWRGQDPLAAPGVFELPFAATSFRVRSVRLVLDTDRRSGWEEIDAVELVGPDGSAWASSATASSYYGQ
ncbi:MAG: HEAT repeat domain-containing protein [Planctomycetaceae bacterium]